MAQIELREDLIASRYDGLATGSAIAYSFETQEGLPVDASNPILREFSPFTLRIIPPSLVSTEDLGADVNLIGYANQSTEQFQASADAVRNLFGTTNVMGSTGGNRLDTLNQIVSAGQVVSSATSITERAVLVDSITAADIARQIETMLSIPPLTMLINPNSLSFTHSVVQQFSNRGRYGYLFERWGEGQLTISISGSTGGFIAAANPAESFSGMQETTTPSGLQFASKRNSAAFQNFTSLFQFYRNGGMVYDTVTKNIGGLMVGAIAIDYDQFTYVGHIESFDYSYQEGMPHRLEWSMEFTVDVLYDHASASLVVQPMVAPEPNPSYPSSASQRAQAGRPDALTGAVSDSTGGLVQVSGADQYAQTPLDLLIP
jgi:hypothetical protein